MACAIAGSTATPAFARGVLLGVSVTVLAVLVPAQVAGFLVDRLSPDWRSYLAIVGVVVLAALAWWPTRVGRKPAIASDGPADGRVAARRDCISRPGCLASLRLPPALGGVFGALLVLEIPDDQPISATDRLYLLSGAQPVTYAGKLLLPPGC